MSVNEYDETSYERLFTYGIYGFFYKKKKEKRDCRGQNQDKDSFHFLILSTINYRVTSSIDKNGSQFNFTRIIIRQFSFVAPDSSRRKIEFREKNQTGYIYYRYSRT